MTPESHDRARPFTFKIPDLSKPPTPPEEFVGWQALSAKLRSLGIGISASALETRRRRYGLPPRESVRGRSVRLTPADLAVWVLHITGIEFDLWTKQLGRARNARLVAVPRQRRRPALASRGIWLPRYFFAITMTSKTHGEQVLRATDGKAYCALRADVFEEKIAGLDTSAWTYRQPRYWRYDYVRVATPADLHRPRYEHRKKKDLAAKTLIVPLSREGNRWEFVYGRGEYFGCAKGTRTRIVVSNQWPRFEELCAGVKRAVPDAVFVAFTRRVELAPVTLDVLTPDLPATGPALLREPPSN